MNKHRLSAEYQPLLQTNEWNYDTASVGEWNTEIGIKQVDKGQILSVKR